MWRNKNGIITRYKSNKYITNKNPINSKWRLKKDVFWSSKLKDIVFNYAIQNSRYLNIMEKNTNLRIKKVYTLKPSNSHKLQVSQDTDSKWTNTYLQI